MPFDGHLCFAYLGRRRRFLGTGAAVVMLFGGAGIGPAATPAGTVISNTAQIDYVYAGAAAGTHSNRVDIRLGEIIDFSVTPAPACHQPASTDGEIAIGFRITNLGNGNEAFVPGAPFVRGGSNFVPRAVVEDSNDNGCHDPDSDRIIPIGGPTRIVVPGGGTTIFVVGSGGNGTGEIVIPVKSATGTGEAGSAIPGLGDDGGDAVIGGAGGTTDGVGVPPASTPLRATLVKSQSVRGADGSAPRKGSIVTYSIEAGFAGAGTAADVVIADPIPAGTSFVAGSLRLDGRAIGDAAGFDGARVSVPLGDVAAPATHRISFQVKID